MMTDILEDQQRLQRACGMSLEAINQYASPETCVILAQTDPQHTVFHVRADNAKAVIEMLLDAACTFGLGVHDTDEEAFDYLTSQLMLKFSELKDYNAREALNRE